MTSISNVPPNASRTNNVTSRFESFPVGGSDPDFVSLERVKPALCSIPLLGKVLPQCR